jgi:two-component sensor histidine kinase
MMQAAIKGAIDEILGGLAEQLGPAMPVPVIDIKLTLVVEGKLELDPDSKVELRLKMGEE